MRVDHFNQIAQKSHSSLVSVTIPFLNSERFLGEAVASVLSQTYPNWELLLVDDGSSDASTVMAKKFAELYPDRIRYLEHSLHQHCGMAASRNLGLRHSTGDYIAQLDSDDVLSTAHLEEKVAILDENARAAMIYGPMRIWNSWDASSRVKPDWVQKFGLRSDQIIHPPRLVPTLLSGRNDPQGVIMRRSQLEEVGGYDYEESIRFYADTAVHCKLALKYPVYVSSRCSYWYRQHAGSYCCAVRAAGQAGINRMHFLQWLDSHLSAEERTDPQVRRALAWAVWKGQHQKIEQCLDLPGRIRQSIARRVTFMMPNRQ